MEKTVGKKWAFTAVLTLIAWVPVRLLAQVDSGRNDVLLRLCMIIGGACGALYFRFGAADAKQWKAWARALFPFMVLGAFMLLLPVRTVSQSLDNVLFFLPVLVWFSVWYSYSDFRLGDRDALARFVRLSGEVVIWFVLFMLGGAVLVALSIALFDIVGIDAAHFYIENIVTLGVCAAPFVALAVIEVLPGIRLASVLGVVFIPLFLVTITVFGVVAFFAEKKPWDNRDVFILYNVLLVLVICLLVFVSSEQVKNGFIASCTSVLPVITIALDLVVLSAILYRIRNWGVTPSKATLLATNLVMLGNLVDLVVARITSRTFILPAARAASWIPAYALLAVLVVFVFPFLFAFA